MVTKKKIAAIFTAAAAIAFATAPISATVAHAMGKKMPCYGVNACKGKSQCKTSANACKGQNSCKGKGVMMKTEKQCTKKGGSTTEPAKS